MKDTGFLQIDAMEPESRHGIHHPRRRRGLAQQRAHARRSGKRGGQAAYSTVRDLLAFTAAQKDGRLPGGSMMQIAGGAPGTNAILQSEGVWTVVVLTNLDPPFGEGLGEAVMHALTPGPVASRDRQLTTAR